MKLHESEVLDVRLLKWLEMKILHVSLNKIYRIRRTTSKTNEISRYENISYKLKWNGQYSKYLM